MTARNAVPSLPPCRSSLAPCSFSLASARLAGIAGGGTGRRVDHVQHLLDLAGHARAERIEPVADAAGRKVGVVDMIDVGFAERASLRQRFVDRPIEFGRVAGGVLIPNFKISRRRRLAQCLDLSERDLGKNKCPFVLVAGHGHRSPRFVLENTDVELQQRDWLPGRLEA